MPDRVLIAIVVSKPEGLEFVPGALPSATRLVSWAKTQGYDTHLVDDRGGEAPVDTDQLCKVIVDALEGGGQERLIVAFMGHGLFRDLSEEFWLLTKWRTETTGAVNIVKLRDRLATYQPGQLAIISDTCRSLPIAKARYIDGNGVVPLKDYDPSDVMSADFYGTQAAQPAYSEPAALAPNEAYCFFSRVLTDALLGKLPGAIETDAVLGPVVRNDGLINEVLRGVPRLASSYDKSQKPDMKGSWRAPRNVWSEIAKVGAPPEADVLPPVPLAPQGQRNFGTVVPEQMRLVSLRIAAQDAGARIAAQPRPTHFESGTGLAINGAEVRKVIAGGGFSVDVVERPDWFRVTPLAWPSATAFVAQLSTGLYAAAALISGYIATLTVGENGVESLILRRSSEDHSPATPALGRMQSGQDLGDLEAIARTLREGPAADPVLAALATYAYARAGAFDALAELTSRFAADQKPMPFDLALVARLLLSRSEAGLTADVTGICVPVAGSFPWLRQGWARVEDDRRPLVRRLAEFAVPGEDRGLAPSPFTTFKVTTGAAIAQLIVRREL